MKDKANAFDTTEKKIMVTGGAGFIGSALIRFIIRETNYSVLNVDKLTYAANTTSLKEVESSDRYHFEHQDICDRSGISAILAEHKPDSIIHLAAESHVDRSLDEPGTFIQTNVFGTYILLDSTLEYLRNHWRGNISDFRFHHVSTDEVFGSLGAKGRFFEDTPYRPTSPYSASKASSDHFVRAWNLTYGLPTIITNSSNNYGPYQNPEKLIPLMILNALDEMQLPIYGSGKQVRDWLHVNDHVRAIFLAFEKGQPGETYNIGGGCELRNIDVVSKICDFVDELSPAKSRNSRRQLITFVKDRPAHDQRYAIDSGKIQRDLHWTPIHTFDNGLRDTVQWYLSHSHWWLPNRAKFPRKRLGLERKSSLERRLSS